MMMRLREFKETYDSSEDLGDMFSRWNINTENDIWDDDILKNNFSKMYKRWGADGIRVKPFTGDYDKGTERIDAGAVKIL
jgi:hypothetical protein